MAHRNALDRLRESAQDPIQTIPSAERKKRKPRTWDRENPVISYFIPAPLTERAKEIRESILALAQHHMTTASSVATALMNYALRDAGTGKLKLDPRPAPQRRKMTLVLEDAKEWPREIPQAQPRQVRKTRKMYLGYRWSRDVDIQIKALAGSYVPVGEVVVFLLNHALTEYKNGNCTFRETAIALAQEVEIT